MNRKRTLVFKPFQPETTEKKDFSGLVERIKGLSCYQERSRNSETTLLRGSTLSNYEGNGLLVKGHKHSDIDIYAVKRNVKWVARRIHQHKEEVETPEGRVPMSIDFTSLRKSRLERELEGQGEDGVLALNDFVMLSTPIENPEGYRRIRNGAMLAYLRIGLGRYPDEYDTVTTSGAMQATIDGLLRMNFLRWWSMQQAFKDSPTADQNRLHFYEDVDRAMHEHLERAPGRSDGETVYRIPDGLPLSRTWDEKWGETGRFYLGKMFGRMFSSPPITPSDPVKFAYKIYTYGSGLGNDKDTVEGIFGEQFPEEALEPAGQPILVPH